MIFLCYRRYSWQFDSFGIAKSHIHNNGFCGFNSWQVEQEPVSLVHPWFTPFRLYIFRFLHQTTTIRYLNLMMKSCISFVSYIKPQLDQIKVSIEIVVYLSFPTSNHNRRRTKKFTFMLYIFRFLHQTTTCNNIEQPVFLLYIFRFLHQTTTIAYSKFSLGVLYIFRFLHQTTTNRNSVSSIVCCISFVSYIKPQL